MGQIGSAIASAAASARGAASSVANQVGANIQAPGHVMPTQPIVQLPGQSQQTDPLAPLPQADQSQAMPAPQQSMLQALTGNAPSPVLNPAQASQTDVVDTSNTDPNNSKPVVQDTWTPTHHEGTLGKIADFLLMMKGRSPVFRERTDNANMADAMADYRKNPTQQNLELAAQRISQIGDMAQQAFQMHQGLQQDQFYEGTNAERKAIGTELGMNAIGGMMGMIQQQSDPAKAYQTMLPTMQAFQKKYDLPELPQQYDPQAVAGWMGGAFKPADQARVGIEGQRLGLDQTKFQVDTQIRQKQLMLDAQKVLDDNKRIQIDYNNSLDNDRKTEAYTNNSNSIMYTRNMTILQKQFKNVPALTQIPWFMDYFAKQPTGSGPRPNRIYASPDGSAGIANIKGGWYVIDMANKKIVKPLTPPTDSSSDMSN